MTFHDIRFPRRISLGAEGGPMRRTEIVTLASGAEERNSPWVGSRRRWNAGVGTTSLAAIEDVTAFFEARHGRLYAFRWQDPLDWKSCPLAAVPGPLDQSLGTGDGQQTVFQLVKAYVSGDQTFLRTITKPVLETVLVAVDGVAQTPGSDYTVDHLSGLVTFATAPPAGATVTAGFEFDVPVRFDTDELRITLPAAGAARVPDIPVVEVLA
ncbi:MAG: DUF2460 domain-containing protein [Aquisalinus sp.]|nr:DUF2460 domain-containing protein [Aquisalinus sp.]